MASAAVREEKHPHVRGEDTDSGQADTCKTETPPRAWGRHFCTEGQYCDIGNTPTCVGKTPPLDEPEREHQKHPHVRGEDEHMLTSSDSVMETPPRAWGRHHEKTPDRKNYRNTPTCVGKTEYEYPWLPQLWKHPHVRGEDPTNLYGTKIIVETPPRAWGRRNSALRQVQGGRNTPTCVGKTTHSHNEGQET